MAKLSEAATPLTYETEQRGGIWSSRPVDVPQASLQSLPYSSTPSADFTDIEPTRAQRERDMFCHVPAVSVTYEIS